MWANEEKNPRNKAGCLSVPLFTRRKRSRSPSSSTRPNECQSSCAAAPPYSQRYDWKVGWNMRPQQTTMRSGPAAQKIGLMDPPKPVNTWPAQQRPTMTKDFPPAAALQKYGGFPSSPSLDQTRFPGSHFDEPSTNWPIESTRPQQCFSEGGTVSSKASLRVVTAVISVLKHWSTSKVPLLFEIFARLDSAVTVGENGAKKFLLRERNDTVMCLYYENDLQLPKLIRGQVHRCVGTYSRERDTLTCVSVRVASLTEQRNAQEAFRASDVEMRSLAAFKTEI